VSRQTAEKVYGVVLDDNGRSLDRSATLALRQNIRRSRKLNTATTHDEASSANTRHVGRYGEYLEIVEEAGHRSIACKCCGHRLCEGNADPKAAVSCQEVPLRAAGPLFPSDDKTDCMLRLYWCPGCGIQFAAEIAEKGSQRLVDIELSVLQ
jgi:acetone carboxylase gamma subunit